MNCLALIGCSAQKHASAMPAQDIYCSERFLLSKSLAQDFATSWFIVSAKHGLINPQTVLEPYDTPLNSLSASARKKWLRNLTKELQSHFSSETQLVAIGDAEYFSELFTSLTKERRKLFAPLSHIPKTNWIAWLKMAQKSSRRQKDIEALYLLLAELEIGLGSARQFGECSGAMKWPERGLYLFFDPEETRVFNPNILRVVRVGTHAVSEGSKSTLWQRLKTHRGNEDGSGSHRASIFRCHVGAAIMKKRRLAISTWGDVATANEETRLLEAKMELQVSSYLKQLKVLWLNINDRPSKFSDRAYLEQNIIALLSGHQGPIDVAEEGWLGYYCPNSAIQRSGLWNVNYTDFEYDPGFFDVLKFYVGVTLGKEKPPKESVAPKTWYEAVQSGYKQRFLNISS